MPLIQHVDSFLVVVDAQPGFYDERSDFDETQFKEFVARAAWVGRLAVAVSVPVIVTEEQSERNGPTAEEICAVLTDDVFPLPKGVFALTGDARIRSAVESTGRRTAGLVGMETDVCIAQSAIALVDLGYRTVVVADAVFSPGEAHDHGLRRIEGTGVEVIAAKGLFYEWLPTISDVQEVKRRDPRLGVPPGFKL